MKTEELIENMIKQLAKLKEEFAVLSKECHELNKARHDIAQECHARGQLLDALKERAGVTSWVEIGGKLGRQPNNQHGFPGTLRDWFAGQSLAGAYEYITNTNMDCLAKECYAMADAMLKAGGHV